MPDSIEHTRSAHPPETPPCKAIRVIGVRGSTEPQHGSRLLVPIGDALAAQFPDRISYTELDYPATIERFVPPDDIDLGESPSIGVERLVTLLNEASSGSHPDCCFVLLGYSQGAQVVGDALLPASMRICGRDAGVLSPAASERIAAVTLFGDPRFTKGDPFNTGTFDPAWQGLWPRPQDSLARFSKRMQSFCNRDDVTCQGRGGNLEAHTAYFRNTMPDQAVAFIAQRLRSNRCVA